MKRNAAPYVVLAHRFGETDVRCESPRIGLNLPFACIGFNFTFQFDRRAALHIPETLLLLNADDNQLVRGQQAFGNGLAKGQFMDLWAKVFDIVHGRYLVRDVRFPATRRIQPWRRRHKHSFPSTDLVLVEYGGKDTIAPSCTVMGFVGDHQIKLEVGASERRRHRTPRLIG